MLRNIKRIIKKNKSVDKLARKFVGLLPQSWWRLRGEFTRFFELLGELERQPYEQVRAYQLQQLKKLVNSAYENSDFYRKKFDRAGFNPSDLQSLEDLTKIPILTKEEIRANAASMIANGKSPEKLLKAKTSGTTGHSLSVYIDEDVIAREWASITYQWSRIGYQPGEGRIELRGLVPDGKDFMVVPELNVLRINVITISEANLDRILERMRQSGFRFLQGYPSALVKFAKLMKNRNDLPNLKGIFMGSEMIYDWQVDLVASVFKCPIMAHYGQAEGVALAGWKGDRKYRFIPAYGIVERDLTNNGLIATSLINDVTPLIRYRLTDGVEDFAERNTGTETLFPVVEKIKGRMEDETFDDQGRRIPCAVVAFPFQELRVIDKVKLIQYSIGNVDLLVNSKRSPDDAGLNKEIERLIGLLKSLYGEKTIFTIRHVDDIPEDANGKYRWVECRIP